MNMIKNIIFDVSDVLTMHVHGSTWSNEQLAKETGVPLQVIKDFFKEYIAAGRKTQGLSFEEFWPHRTVDTGTLRLEDVQKSGQRHANNIVVNPEMVSILERLQPQYRLFALTNAWKPGHPHKAALEQYFIAFVQSCDIGMWKPNKDVFNYMVSTYSLIPYETLFIDNSTENITAAKTAGLEGLLFIDVETLRIDLQKKQIADV